MLCLGCAPLYLCSYVPPSFLAPLSFLSSLSSSSIFCSSFSASTICLPFFVMPLPLELNANETQKQFKGRAAFRVAHIIAESVPSSTVVLSVVKGFLQTTLSECDVSRLSYRKQCLSVKGPAGNCSNIRGCKTFKHTNHWYARLSLKQSAPKRAWLKFLQTHSVLSSSFPHVTQLIQSSYINQRFMFFTIFVKLGSKARSC